MQIFIYPPKALCNKGNRSKNEDNIYPSLGKANASSNTFLVCDGVGGAEKGELASLIVATAFGTAFSEQKATTQNLHEELDKIQTKIDSYLQENPLDKGMGTTLTFLQLNQKGAIIAHAGDSRVYHIRKDEILFRTSDHSLVNELIKRGKIEEAELAPDNVITRAIQGKKAKQITLDVKCITDIQADDYFLLCSDGVWGVIPDKDLIRILYSKVTDEGKINAINNICLQASKDNYSAYLIRIQKVTSKSSDNTLAFSTTENNNFKSISQQNILVEDTRKGGKFFKIVFLILALLSFIVGLYLWSYHPELFTW